MRIYGRRQRFTPLKEFQEQLKNLLQELFQIDDVEEEWASMRDEYGLSIYSPRIDVAVGPFATHERLGHIYDEMINDQYPSMLIKKLVEFNRMNLEAYDGFVQPVSYDEIKYLNHNARCFLAIEIENLVSRKHLMGGAINASALGRIGIVIPWSQEKLRAFVKLVRYLQYLKYAEKNTFNTSNLLIVTKEQMVTAIYETLNSDQSTVSI